VDLDECRELAGTEDTWQQEYCCKFLDESTAWLPYSLIESCTHADASLRWDTTQPPSGPCWLGFDVGRKRDLSVGWLNEQRGAVHWTRAVVVMERQPFRVQRQALWDLMPIARRACIDQTGIGAQIAEETVEHWGETQVEGITFGPTQNAKMAAKLRGALESKTLMLPDDDGIRRDLHSVRRVYTDKGRQSFDAPHGREGHADRFWAAALALHASDDALLPLQPNEVKTLPTGQRGLGERTFGRSWGDY
jgi:phage FluMu gp28-like protein